MNLRTIAGITHGLIGWISWGLARRLPDPLRTRLQRQALLAVCRMYRIGGGVDEGAYVLMEGWGPEGHEALKRQLDQGKIPAGLVSFAELLLMVGS